MDTINHNGHTVTAEYDDRGAFNAKYLGYNIHISRDEFNSQNPWTDQDGLAPTLAYYQERSDLGENDVETEIMKYLDTAYVQANYAVIGDTLEDIRGDDNFVKQRLMELFWDQYDESLILEPMYSEAFPNGREPSERTQLIRRNKAWAIWFNEGLDELHDAYAEYLTETLTRLYHFAVANGMECEKYISNGHSQGDQTTLLVVLTDDWKNTIGYDGCTPDVGLPVNHPEYAKAKAKVYLDEAYRIYTGWAWGDVYEFNCSHDSDYLWTEETGYDCYYGSDFAESGLLKSACELIDQRLSILEDMRLERPLLDMDALHEILRKNGMDYLQEVVTFQRGLYADAPTYQQVVDYCISISK